MDWREVTIYTTTAGIGPVEAVLEDNGIEGYVLEDAADFEEFLKDTEIYWDYVDEELVREKRAQETCLKIYLSDDEAGAKQYAALRTSLENLKARDEEHAWGRLVTETRAHPSGGLGMGLEAVFQAVPGRTFVHDQALVGNRGRCAGPPHSGNRPGVLVRHGQPRHHAAVYVCT